MQSTVADTGQVEISDLRSAAPAMGNFYRYLRWFVIAVVFIVFCWPTYLLLQVGPLPKLSLARVAMFLALALAIIGPFFVGSMFRQFVLSLRAA